MGRIEHRFRGLKPCRTVSAEVLFGALCALFAATGSALHAQSGAVYFPEPGSAWQHRSPEDVGMDRALVEEAVAFATDTAHAGFIHDLHLQMLLYPPGEPLNELVGPTKPRGPQAGMIVRDGYIVAEWGDPHRVDMTFSVSKSFVTTTVGLAYDRGLIRSLDDPVHEYMAPVTAVRRVGTRLGPFRTFELFDTEHNRKITWEHLLRQTSDWEGTLWGKPDWVDRPPEGEPSPEWATRSRHEPGTAFEYNDVRVNVAALAAQNVWSRPLPEVLKEMVMDPIGASSTWRWHGYENSFVLIDGQLMQSVAGGGHWGGGMWISARDQARFGYLFLRNGRWNDRQVLSEEWIRLATTPGTVDRGGFMNHGLNTGRRRVPQASERAIWHSGGGINRIFVDPGSDLVVVVRWLSGRYYSDFIELVLDSVDPSSRAER